MLAIMLLTSLGNVVGTRIDIGRPVTSSAVYPYNRSAAEFQLVITASRLSLRMASSESRTIAARISSFWGLSSIFSLCRGPLDLPDYFHFSQLQLMRIDRCRGAVKVCPQVRPFMSLSFWLMDPDGHRSRGVILKLGSSQGARF